MLCTIFPSASSAWKNRNVFPGTSKYALPSSSTGTVPRMRLFSKLCQFMAGACAPSPNQSLIDQLRFGGLSTIRRLFTVPRLTPFMCVPAYTSWR